jgi:hypothetical protein
MIDMLDNWRRRFGIDRRVKAATSDNCLFPFTFGIAHPIIFIPQPLLDKGDVETIQAIVAHEMVHIKRWDDLWIRLLNIVQCFYFFHPVVWHVNHRIGVAREQICDAAVLSTGKISPQSYGKGILRVLKLGLLDASAGVAKFMPDAGLEPPKMGMKHRIQKITMKETSMPNSNSALIFISVALIGLFLLPMAPVHKADAQQDADSIGQQRFIPTRPMSGWIAGRYDPDRHTRQRFPWKLLRRSSSNPNLQPPQGQWLSFQENLEKNRHPGVDFITAGEPVRAMADGIVHFVGETPKGPNNPGGWYVRVVHDRYDDLKESFYPRIPLYRYQAYRSTYYHLSRVDVKHWQSVKRGQPIGQGMAYGPTEQEMVKIVLEERGNWVNPEDYGPDHGFMRYPQGGGDMEIELEEMNRRLDRQADIVRRFNAFYSRVEKDDIYTKIHEVIDTEKYRHFPVEWSTLERFRFLCLRYQEDPDLFPGLSPADVNAFKEEYAGNQPIILSLPFLVRQ